MESLLQMDELNFFDWRLDETGLLAINIKTSERILLSRFEDSTQKKIRYLNRPRQTFNKCT